MVFDEDLNGFQGTDLFCVTYEARAIHRDHDSSVVVGVVSVRIFTLLVSDQYLLKGCNDFFQILEKGKAS